MCLITRFPLPRIALKDKKVWKVVLVWSDGKIRSPIWRRQYWKTGITVRSKVKVWPMRVYYSLPGRCFRYIFCIEEGLYSFTTREAGKSGWEALSRGTYVLPSSDFELREFVIPKGAIYILGKSGEVVSNKLRML